MKRVAISKRMRFDVFKRDGFVCQYCGAHPPDVLLHADHIRPVIDDGETEMDNLVTACQACNLGKGPRSLNVVPQSLSEKAKQIAEKEAQLLGYQEVMESRRERIEKEMWRVAELLQPGCSESGMSRDWLSGIRRFNNDLGLDEVLDSAEKARDKYPWGGKRTFRYFCGICWNLIRTRPQ